jgi:hypothetical protein
MAKRKDKGAVLVEAAIVLPLFSLILIGTFRPNVSSTGRATARTMAFIRRFAWSNKSSTFPLRKPRGQRPRLQQECHSRAKTARAPCFHNSRTGRNG